jgi:hypothetical protein
VPPARLTVRTVLAIQVHAIEQRGLCSIDLALPYHLMPPCRGRQVKALGRRAADEYGVPELPFHVSRWCLLSLLHWVRNSLSNETTPDQKPVCRCPTMMSSDMSRGCCSRAALECREQRYSVKSRWDCDLRAWWPWGPRSHPSQAQTAQNRRMPARRHGASAEETGTNEHDFFRTAVHERTLRCVVPARRSNAACTLAPNILSAVA